MNSANKNRKIALVSGASGGIGSAICASLLVQGYGVIGTARNQSRLEPLLQQSGDRFYPLQLDLTDADAVAGIKQQLPPEFSDIEVLINNAGHDVGGRRSFELGSASQWCDIIETNVQGTIRLTHALIDGMLERGCGHIINMGSTAGHKPYATGSAYVSSKFALHGLSESLRLDFAGRGIRITEMVPGLVRSGFAAERLGDEQAAQEFYDSFEACLKPEDVAAAVIYALAQPPHVEIAQMVILPTS